LLLKVNAMSNNECLRDDDICEDDSEITAFLVEPRKPKRRRKKKQDETPPGVMAYEDVIREAERLTAPQHTAHVMVPLRERQAASGARLTTHVATNRNLLFDVEQGLPACLRRPTQPPNPTTDIEDKLDAHLWCRVIRFRQRDAAVNADMLYAEARKVFAGALADVLTPFNIDRRLAILMNGPPQVALPIDRREWRRTPRLTAEQRAEAATEDNLKLVGNSVYYLKSLRKQGRGVFLTWNKSGWRPEESGHVAGVVLLTGGDFISAGCAGLMRAVRLFNPDRCVEFNTYARRSIRKAANGAFRGADLIKRPICNHVEEPAIDVEPLVVTAPGHDKGHNPLSVEQATVDEFVASLQQGIAERVGQELDTEARNRDIFDRHICGEPAKGIANRYSLVVKQVGRIVRDTRRSPYGMELAGRLGVKVPPKKQHRNNYDDPTEDRDPLPARHTGDAAALLADGYIESDVADLRDFWHVSSSTYRLDKEHCQQHYLCSCGRRGLTYRPFHNLHYRSYRALMECPKCGKVYEM
jgi:hypothetical protein